MCQGADFNSGVLAWPVPRCTGQALGRDTGVFDYTSLLLITFGTVCRTLSSAFDEWVGDEKLTTEVVAEDLGKGAFRRLRARC